MSTTFERGAIGTLHPAPPLHSVVPLVTPVRSATGAAGEPRAAGHLDLLQVLRGVAATLVVVYHVNPIFRENFGGSFLGGKLDFGFSGVDLFFVLSGFVITYVHAKDIGRPDRVRSFAWRRFVRVFPLYWLVLLAKLGSEHVLRGGASSAGPSMQELVRGIALLPQRGGFSSEKLLGVSWTLTFEVLFYLVFSLLIVSRSRWVRVAIGMWISLCVVRLLFVSQYFPFAISSDVVTNQVVLEFLLGVLIATMYRRNLLPPARLLLRLGAVAFGLCALGYSLGAFSDHDRFLTFGLAAALVVAGCVALEREGGSTGSSRVWRALGDGSYSIYLLHGFFINQASRFISGRAPWTVASAGGRAVLGTGLIVLTLLFGWTFHRLVEKPMLAVLRRTVRL